MKNIILAFSLIYMTLNLYGQWDPQSGVNTTTSDIGIGADPGGDRLRVTDTGAATKIARFYNSSSLLSGQLTGIRLQGKDNAGANNYFDYWIEPNTGKYGFGHGTSGSNIPINSGISHADIVVDAGNIGIGTISPNSKLHVTSSNYRDFLILDRTSNSNIQNVFHLTPSWDTDYNDQLRIGTGTSDIISFEETGNVGIGTDNPNATLQVGDSDHTGAPSSEVEIKRLSLAPVTHSGSDWFFTTRDNSPYANLDIGYSTNKSLTLRHDGNIGIGTTDPQSKLAVDGQIRATEVKVLADITVPDYVFESDYELRTLVETKEFIEENKHLPEIPSATEIAENGIDIGDMNMRLLKKIEDLTLYQIVLMEKLEQQNVELQNVKKELQELKK